MRHSGVRGVAAALLFSRAAFALSLWTSADAIPAGVPEACRKALARDIACGDSLVTAAQALSGRALGRGAAARYCTQACHDSLQAFRAEVEQHCGDAAHRMFPNSSLEQSGAVLASGLLWAYSLTCIRDSSGFCLEELYNGTREACSQCALQYGTVMAGSPWGQGAVSRESFSSLLSSCGSDPTSYSIPPPQASSPHGSPSLSAPDAGMHEPADAAGGRAGTKAASPACSGETYIVREGDTCVSIASAAGVATDRMIDLNRLDYDCSALAVGMKLCLQDACATHTVMANETCSSITKGREFSGIQLRSWNPTIHRDCGNLDSMVGRSICLSPPGRESFDVDLEHEAAVAQQHIHPTLTSPMFSSWLPATALDTYSPFTTSWYTPTLGPEAAAATQTNWYNETRASLVAQRTRHCWIKADAWDGGLGPEDLPRGCQSLLDTYCFPTPEAPVPRPPAHVPAVCSAAGAAPAPTNPTPVAPRVNRAAEYGFPVPTAAGDYVHDEREKRRRPFWW